MAPPLCKTPTTLPATLLGGASRPGREIALFLPVAHAPFALVCDRSHQGFENDCLTYALTWLPSHYQYKIDLGYWQTLLKVFSEGATPFLCRREEHRDSGQPHSILPMGEEPTINHRNSILKRSHKTIYSGRLDYFGRCHKSSRGLVGVPSARVFLFLFCRCCSLEWVSHWQATFSIIHFFTESFWFGAWIVFVCWG